MYSLIEKIGNFMEVAAFIGVIVVVWYAWKHWRTMPWDGGLFTEPDAPPPDHVRPDGEVVPVETDVVTGVERIWIDEAPLGSVVQFLSGLLWRVAGQWGVHSLHQKDDEVAVKGKDAPWYRVDSRLFAITELLDFRGDHHPATGGWADRYFAAHIPTREGGGEGWYALRLLRPSVNVADKLVEAARAFGRGGQTGNAIFTLDEVTELAGIRWQLLDIARVEVDGRSQHGGWFSGSGRGSYLLAEAVEGGDESRQYLWFFKQREGAAENLLLVGSTIEPEQFHVLPESESE